jgi:Outer membrane protein beta-barrel domain
MRVLVVTAFIVFIFQALATYSQTVIPRAGLAVSTAKFESLSPDQEVSSRSGFSFGLGLGFPLTERLDLLVEFDYISKRYDVYSNEQSAGGRSFRNSLYKHNYLEVPVMAKKYFGNRVIQYYLNAGGYMGLGMGGKVTSEYGTYGRGGGITYRSDLVIKYGDPPKRGTSGDLYYDHRADFGIIGGLGIVFFRVIAIDVRYGLGLVDVNNGHKNRTLQLALAVPFKAEYAE